MPPWCRPCVCFDAACCAWCVVGRLMGPSCSAAPRGMHAAASHAVVCVRRSIVAVGLPGSVCGATHIAPRPCPRSHGHREWWLGPSVYCMGRGLYACACNMAAGGGPWYWVVCCCNGLLVSVLPVVCACMIRDWLFVVGLSSSVLLGARWWVACWGACSRYGVGWRLDILPCTLLRTSTPSFVCSRAKLLLACRG